MRAQILAEPSQRSRVWRPSTLRRGAPAMVMTLTEFARFLREGRVTVLLDEFEIVRCACRDQACHGWRLVAPRQEKRN